MLLTNSAGSVRLYTVIHSRSELQCILPIERIFQDGGRLVVFIFIIARQRSSDGRQVRLIGTRPKASRAIEFAINRPTTNIYIYIYHIIYLHPSNLGCSHWLNTSGQLIIFDCCTHPLLLTHSLITSVIRKKNGLSKAISQT